MQAEFEPIDYTDLADVVQRLRMIGWRATLGPANLLKETGRHVPWFEDLQDFQPYIRAMRELAERTEGEQHEECLLLADETERVYAALLAKPRKPDPDDVIARFVGGEIGDRTAQYVLGWDAFRLADECIKRRLPPLQIVTDDPETGINIVRNLLNKTGKAS